MCNNNNPGCMRKHFQGDHSVLLFDLISDDVDGFVVCAVFCRNCDKDVDCQRARDIEEKIQCYATAPGLNSKDV